MFAINRSYTAAQGDLEGESKRGAGLNNELEIAQMKLSQYELEVCFNPIVMLLVSVGKVSSVARICSGHTRLQNIV